MLHVTSTQNAAEAARRRMLEEEEMTQYSDEMVSGEWEFKIVRSPGPKFRNPEEFAKLLAEEAEFGWILLEKLDDGRVRFKRSVSERARDGMSASGRDPYRSIYGRTFAGLQGMAIMALMLVIVAFILFIILIL